LVKNAEITERSPIIFTAPTNYDGPLNTVVAKNFYTFLRLLLRYGWFELIELGYQPKTAIEAFFDAPRSFGKGREDEPNYVEDALQ